MCFADALERPCWLSGQRPDRCMRISIEEVEALGSLLYRAFSAGQFELHRSPPSLTATIGARPRASFLARQQAENGVAVTNLRHRSVSLKDEAVRKFLILVDGTRTVQDLVFDLKATIPEGVGATVTHDGVEENLRLLAKLGLLVPDGAGFDAAPAPPGGAIPMPAPTHDRHATGGI